VSQRRHWYAYEIGAVPVHDPADVDSVEPACATPDTTGNDVFAGGEVGDTTVEVGSEYAVAEAHLFVAVTATRSVTPTSKAVTR
jgi:hypothetical protein